jgi:glutamate-1-semialdehyde 2,1-aminomutase
MKLTPTSKELYKRACKVFPSGSTRAPFFLKPYPVYMIRAEGCRMWDVDGREYIDFVNNMGPLILGHRHPKVLEAVKEQLEHFWAGAPSELEIELAEKILACYPFCDQISFTPSGTEAVMNAVRAARAYSGKYKLIIFEGSYHGSSDSVYPVAGVPKELSEKILLVPFNDRDTFERIFNKNKDELAAVLVEPVLNQGGGIPPNDEFLKVVREITEENGVLLIFDEVVTGFRLALGGASERFSVKPDIITLGKIIGGGFPLGAFAGSQEIMKIFEYPKTLSIEIKKPKVPHPGTFNEHKIAMAAGLATIKELNKNSYEHLETTGNMLREGIQKICLELNINTQVTGIGSMFDLLFTDEEVIDIKTANSANELLKRYFDLAMLNRGVRLAPAHTSFCSVPMTANDIKFTLDAMRSALEQMRTLICEIAPELITSL